MSLTKGNSYFWSGKYELAVQEYKKIAHDSPLYREAQSNIERAHRSIGKHAALTKPPISTSDQLARLSAVFNASHPKSGWTAIITLWKRSEYLAEQLEAILAQTIAPRSILVVQNESHFAINPKFLSIPNLKLISSGLNSLYTRWIIGYLCDSKYVCVFDDDVIPGKKWIELCIKISDKYAALVGPSGRLARPKNEPAWISVETDQTGSDQICDWVCNSYFFQTDWIRYIVAASRYEGYQMTFDDIQLATTLKAFGEIRAVVPGQPKSNRELNGHIKREYGHDDHALWKRRPTEHMSKRSELIRRIDLSGFQWCSSCD